MDNSGNNLIGFISNNVNNGGMSSSIDRANRSRLSNNASGENGVRRGSSGDVSAARSRNLLLANSGSREEYNNLTWVGPYAQMVIMEEMRHMEEANRMASSHQQQQAPSLEISPGFCTSKSSDPSANHKEASHSDMRTSTSNGTSGSGLNDGSLFKRYIREAASRIKPSNGNMQGIEQVVRKMNSSPEQASSIMVCSNGDARSADKSSYTGSIIPQSSSQYIIQPCPGHHTKIPTSNHGLFENRHKVHLNEGSAQRNVSISQEKPLSISTSNPEVVMMTPLLITESTDPEVVMMTPLFTTEAHNSPRQSAEPSNQTAGVNLPQLPNKNYGVKNVISETSAISPNLKQWQNFLYRYQGYRIKYENMQNNSVSFSSIAHEKLCVRQCKCEFFSRILSHYDKCTNPNCQLCVPGRKLRDSSEVHKESRKRKNDTANSNIELNDTVTGESNLPFKCQKLENSILSSDKTTTNQPLESHQLPMDQLLSNTDDQKNEAKMNLKEHNIHGMSLTEFFTAAELKEHLCSFGQWIGQEVGTSRSLCQNKCQLCAMDKLEFAPAPMYCFCCRSPIKHDMNYYQAFDESGAKRCFCSSCFRNSRKTILTFPKAQLQKEKNNLKDEESWVQCDKCEGWQHQICALYNDKRDPGGKAVYTCPKCLLQELETEESQPLSKTVSLYAKDLPRSKLSDHIEKRLFKRLKQEREEVAKNLSKNLGEVPEEAKFSIRVVFSVDKVLHVNKKFLEIFEESNYPSEFPYKSKVILLFQRIEGVDVCLFGLYVQEFGSNCDQPNQRRVYISYMDSIKYMRPEMKTVTGEALRTLVYHEILIGYLDYCKKRGFSTCYIWACPPLKGEDYILYCHPDNQKIPKPDKLQHWYELMLKKAVKENIVVNCTNLYDHFFLSPGGYTTKTVARLPYFEGAYWSITAESIIGTIGKDYNKPKLTKAALKAMGRSTSPTDVTRKDALVMEKLGDTILKDKKKFIIVNLQHSCIRCEEAILSGVRWFCNKCKKFSICSRCLNKEQNLDATKIHISNSGEKHVLSEMAVDDVPCDTEDNDVTVDSNMFASRETFLSFCQRNNYQFDTLRRAKHSSMMILYHLHNSDSVDM